MGNVQDGSVHASYNDSNDKKENIYVTINGTKCEVPKSFSEISLNDFLREHLLLCGTKVMCREGGCGVCIVHVAFPDPDPAHAGQIVEMAINSCLCPILSCDGWEVTSVEGIGSQKNPHPVQIRLTDHYGTQCGYCTPGMVMHMYSLLQNGNLTRQQVEDSFGGNICRCTGYRPILDAFKSFANTETEIKCPSEANLSDIEDFEMVEEGFCTVTDKSCGGNCRVNQKTPRSFGHLLRTGMANAPPWYKPASLPDLYKLMPTLQGNVYYVVGHTGIGVYNDRPYSAYVDLKGISELYRVNKTTDSLVIGANVSLTRLINLCNDYAARDLHFAHLTQLSSLIFLTAHPAVRNIGCWAGNLAMKNRHNDMPSDSFVGFTTMDAKITVHADDGEHCYSTEEFLSLNMTGKIILRVEFPAFANNYVFRTYKPMLRSQNSHAYVLAGFHAKVDRTGGMTNAVIFERPVITFGNIAPSFVRAKQTETFLTGRNLADADVLLKALNILNGEIIPVEAPAEASPAYKRSLSLSLFYKFALEVVGEAADLRYRSAVGNLQRPLSSGVQSYPTNPANYPLTQPIPKLESMIQCTGEARYISDIQADNLLHAAFVISSVGSASIYRIDKTEAMKLPGVKAVLTANDIPGANNIAVSNFFFQDPPEELLASKTITYAGQPIAIVVAVSRDAAEQGAELVRVFYTNLQNAVTTNQEAISRQSFYDPMEDVVVGDAAGAVAEAAKRVSGEMNKFGQGHFHMETQVAISYPTEIGLDVEAGTQWLDNCQSVVAQVAGLTKNRVRVTTRRNGGGFGAKITRNNPIAAATAVAAIVLRQPVKMHMSIWDNFRVIGKRFPYLFRYEVGFDETGKIHGLIMDIYANVGGVGVSNLLEVLPNYLDNGYKIPAWRVSRHACKTNIAPNTSCRAPGSESFIFMIENIVEHVAHSLGLPAIQVKMANFYKDGDVLLDGSTMTNCTISPITNQLLDSSSYFPRLQYISQFNQDNRWRKRGISVVPMRYPAGWSLRRFGCLVTVFHNGGSVIVSHGGVEIGQGINTKVAQVVSHALGIPLDQVIMDVSSTIPNANGTHTGGSVTSEMSCMAAIDCCTQLNERIDPIRQTMPTATWAQLTEALYTAGVNLTAWAWAAPNTPVPPVPRYHAFAAMCTEVELDILTGEYQILRLDVLYDCGESMSPFVDIGQVEGAVVMGLGNYTCEENLFDAKTGENLTYNTWTYKPPTTKDIPVDFRVTLLHNAPNPSGVLRSKLVGEPPLSMTASVVFALRNAIKAQLAEIGKANEWFQMDTPVTRERAQQSCLLDVTQLRYSS